MATVHIALVEVLSRAETGSTMPVPKSQPKTADTVTSTATSQLSSLAAAQAQDDFWSITTTGNVWVKFGLGTPVAALDDGWLILAGQTREFSVTEVGEKIAVKDA